MQAYEFYATPQNGVIPLPEQYKNIITSGVKVIVLEGSHWKFNREEANARRKSDLLLSPTMSTKDWNFSREEDIGSVPIMLVPEYLRYCSRPSLR